MTELGQYEDLFTKVFVTANSYLKLTGLQLNNNDAGSRILHRLRQRWLFSISFIFLNLDNISEIAWLVQAIKEKKSLTEITYLLPCLTQCMLGSLKSYDFFKYSHLVRDIINTLKILRLSRDVRSTVDKFESKSVKFLYASIKITTYTSIVGIGAFGIGPLVIMAVIYYKNGETNLLLPYLMLFPFDQYDIKSWTFIYMIQIWSAIIAVFTVLGPDFIYYACSTFIIIQFYDLKQNIESLIQSRNNVGLRIVNNVNKSKLKEIVEHHKHLIRCVEVLEIVYSRSALFNVASSSVLICLTGFNVMTNNMILMTPFLAFLLMVSGQILLFCYFGDIIMRFSMEISTAVYNCQWYVANPVLVKGLVIMSMRANKPCKLTAYGFSYINLRTFTKILSTSWSYFALLLTLYKNHTEKGELIK